MEVTTNELNSSSALNAKTILFLRAKVNPNVVADSHVNVVLEAESPEQLKHRIRLLAIALTMLAMQVIELENNTRN